MDNRPPPVPAKPPRSWYLGQAPPLPQKPDERRGSRAGAPAGPRPVPPAGRPRPVSRVPPRRKPVGDLSRIATTSSYAPSIDEPQTPRGYTSMHRDVPLADPPYPLGVIDQMPSPQIDTPTWSEDADDARLPTLDSWMSGLSLGDLPDELVPAPARSLPNLPGLHIHQSGAISVPLDLPQLPPMGAIRPPFDAEQLTVAQLDRCAAAWALSAIAQWLEELVAATEAEFQPQNVAEVVAKLVAYHCPALNWVVADALAQQAAASLQQQGFFSTGPDGGLQLHPARQPSGVLVELCGDGCYAPRGDTGCYAPRCLRHRTEPAALRSQPSLRARADLEMDWAAFYKVEIDEDADTTAIKLQYAIHELIMTELGYVRDLSVYIDVYGALESHPSVMADQALFCKQVFGRIRAVLAANAELAAGFRARQRQGPYVSAVGDLVVQWARTASDAYTNYAADYLASDALLRREMAGSPALRAWMAERGRDPRLVGVPHSFYFSRVLPRLARYKLLLGAILKYTPASAAEHGILEQAQAAVGELAAACDSKIAVAQRAIDVDNLRAHVVFKSADVTADLKLGDRRRKLVKRGELLRRGGYKVDWVTSHVLLLDNYFVLSKTKEGQNGTAFYVTKPPIPMDLLVLESADMDGEVKFGSKLTLTRGVPVAKAPTGDGQVTVVEQPKDVLYPLHVTHLGRTGGAYFLYASTAMERERWRDAIVDAKRAHSASAFARNAEPFRLQLLADQFGYPEGQAPKLAVPTPNTVLHRCIGDGAPPYAVARSRVTCIEAVGNDFVAGLDSGVYRKAAGAWFRILDLRSVQSIRAVEEMNLLLVLADRALLWFDLAAVMAAKPPAARAARPPVGRRLSRKRKVYGFSIAYLKDRLVVIYIQQDLANSVLKVVEPVRSAARVASTGVPVVASFREVDRLQVPGEVQAITPFHYSLVLHHAAQGFLYVNLDVKLPRRFPAPELGLGKPLAIYRAATNALVACYELGCVAVSPTGELVANSPPTPFVCAAQAVAYQAPYLVAVSPELVEVRKIETGTDAKSPLVQVISGKDIRLLGSVEGQIRLALAHPRVAGVQLVVAVVGNEFVVIDSTSSISGL